MMTSCTRSRASSLVSRCATCVLAVAGEMYSRSAISALDMPVATRRSTSDSRSVSSWATRSVAVAGGARADWGAEGVAIAPAAAAPAGPRAGAGVLANSPISRRVMLGASSASPAATTRMAVSKSAGSVSLSRNPLAPARSAANTYSSRSKVVRMITRTPAVSGAVVIRRVASMPSRSGIRTSIKTMSGLTARATSTASAPLAASPTTENPGVAAMMPQNPTRTSAWSSATATEIVTSARRPGPGAVSGGRGAQERQRGVHLEAAARQRAGGEVAAAQVRPLTHADDAVPGADDRHAEGTGAGRAEHQGAAAVIGHPDVQGFLAVVEADHAVGAAARVLDHVGERLLDDPVRRQVDASGHRPNLP